MLTKYNFICLGSSSATGAFPCQPTGLGTILPSRSPRGGTYNSALFYNSIGHLLLTKYCPGSIAGSTGLWSRGFNGYVMQCKVLAGLRFAKRFCSLVKTFAPAWPHLPIVLFPPAILLILNHTKCWFKQCKCK